jgi:omega-hydroxy-beta-dihydromenaquinone-9 sulfotransferase
MNSLPAQTPTNDYPTWAPRFWHGMRPWVWWKLLSRNRYRIALKRAHVAVGVSLITPINELLWATQQLLMGRKIRATVIDQPPIFILGHWRSGTTLLHELLVSNTEFASPNTYQCFAPSHFLVSGSIITRFGGFLLPKKRPMDEMAAGWLLPQEDEFALMNLGLPSPYLRIAFPQTQEKHLEYLNFDEISEAELQLWREGFIWFVKALTIAYRGQRLVLKSPTHTGRIAELHKMFPEACFIHLTRDPRKLFPSTMRLWRSLDHVQSLHDSYNEDQLIQYVQDCLDKMYLGYHRGRTTVPDSQVMDVRYEDLVADPKATVQEIYHRMNLGDFNRISAALDEKLVGHGEYRTNQHFVDEEWERQVMSYCADYAARYGYT